MGRRDRGLKRRMARATPQKVHKNGAQPQKKRAEGAPKGQVRRKGTEEEWLATLLHNERALVNDLRRELLQKEQALVNAMVANGNLQARIISLEIAAKDREMAQVRETYGIRVGATIHKDDETGEVYYLEDEKMSGKNTDEGADSEDEIDDPDEQADALDDPSESDEESDKELDDQPEDAEQ